MTAANPDRWAAPNYTRFTGSDATSLQQTFASLSNYLEKINNSVTIASGVGVLSLTGTTNQITVSASTGAVTLSFPTNLSLSGDVSVPFNGKFIDSSSTNYFTPRDQFGNMYHKLTSGSFYVDANNYYFRNQAATDLLTIDVNGNTFTRGNVYGSRSGAQLHMGAWTVTASWGAIEGGNGYLLMTNTGTDRSVYLRTKHNSNVNIGGADANTLVVSSSRAVMGAGALFGGSVGRNRGSYGGVSFQSDGTTNTWDGIEFQAPTTQTFMVQNDNYSGMFRANAAWNWLWSYNTLVVGSDIRYKRDIQPLNMGLNFIEKLEPISYLKLTESCDDDPEATEDGYYYGFSAQNVRAALDACGETRNVKIHDIGGPNMGLVACTENAVYDRQYLGVTEFMGPVVLAIKELEQRLSLLEGTV
jgi:hypothetical protein